MQKKLIALAIAGLMSAPAFAQSNVTLYGTVDFGFVSMGGADGTYVDPDGHTRRYSTRNSFDSGVSKNNRIGFRGTEDLGNGLKAVFVLETGLNGDSGSMFRDANARQTYAGLAGGFGTVAIGRQYTPQHVYTAAVDPFAKNGLGNTGNVQFQDRRLNNLLAYISPDFGGFKFITGYSWAGIGEEALQNDDDLRVWAFAPSFTWNNLFVAANYHNVRFNRNKVTGDKSTSLVHAYDLFASYDFGFVKLGSTLGRRVTKKNVLWAGDNNSRITQFMFGATFKITPNDAIQTSYSRASENRVWDGQDGKPRIDQWAIGYSHNLSKRTALYGQFAIIGRNSWYKDGNGFHTAGDIGPVGNVNAGYLPDIANTAQYRRGFTIGFRHDF